MVGLNETKTNAGGSIRNRTGRLNRASEAMKAVKEDDYDSGGGGGGQTDTKRGVAKVHELEDKVEQSAHQETNHNVGDRLLLEDSSSSHSNPADPYEIIINSQQSHRTPRQHQQHPKPPHHLVPISHRNDHKAPRQQHTQEQTSPKHWGKNIEDSISGILKRLDQMAAGRENNGTLLYPSKSIKPLGYLQ